MQTFDVYKGFHFFMLVLVESILLIKFDSFINVLSNKYSIVDYLPVSAHKDSFDVSGSGI